MTDLESLRGLEKRLAEASGPSLDLDKEIFLTVDDGFGARVTGHTYTASLDAAVALEERVLPGWRIFFTYTPGKVCQLRLIDTTGPEPDDGEDWPHVKGMSTHPALALCLAIVRALIK